MGSLVKVIVFSIMIIICINQYENEQEKIKVKMEKQKQLQEECKKLLEDIYENNVYFENKEYYELIQGDEIYYSNEKEFLNKFTNIISDGKLDYKSLNENANFQNCIDYLVENKYLVLVEDNNSIIKLLNNAFNIGIDENKFDKNFDEKYKKYFENGILFDSLEIRKMEICKILKDRGLYLVVLYVNSTCLYYGVLKYENAEKLKEIFAEISKEVLEARENKDKNENPDIIAQW